MIKTKYLLIILFSILVLSFAKAENKKVKKIMNPDKKTEVATLAGGCFWGMEELYKKLDGVTDTRVGYTGGAHTNPAYTDVKSGLTGHAEAVEIHFKPQIISFSKVLEYFFKIHDPTQKDRQQNDVGSQYRSAIFYHSEEQRITAESMIKRVNDSKKWSSPVVTLVESSKKFWPAEDYHQDYLGKNPKGYSCHYVRDFSF